MKRNRPFRFVTPRELDERVQSIQLFVIRDTFIAILLLAVLFVSGLALSPLFVKEHLGEIGGTAVAIAGLVAWTSNHLRSGRGEEQKILFAKGDLLLAPLLAAIVVFLTTKLTGAEESLPEWLLFYGVTLLGLLVYPLFILRRGHKPADRQGQTSLSRHRNRDA